MKKVLSLIIVLAVVLSSIGVLASDIRVPDNLPTETLPTTPVAPTVPETPKTTFSDVDANTSTGVAIYKLVNAGILNGYQDGTFRPNNPITRAELCKIVNLVFGYTEAEELTFSDVKKDDWYYNYVAIAKKAGYITGHADGTFKGNDYLTREQTCAIITRVTKLFDLPMTETITDTVSPWAVPYVNKVVANRLMPLEAGGKFRATENITRAELVVVVSNFVIEDEKPSDNANQFTVTFNTNGGSTINAVKVETGKTVAKPGNPTKTGYTFAGWYSDSTLTKTFDFNTKITANTTLYAKWNKNGMGGGSGGSGGGGSGGSGGSSSGGSGGSNTGGNTGGGNTGGNTGGGTTEPTPVTYTVTFNTNSGSSIDSVTVNKGDTVSRPEDPTRDDYIFKGWFTTSALTIEYDFSSSIEKNTTIYAKWAQAWTVSFETNGGDYIEPVIVEHGMLLTEPEVSPWQGYYFMGWYNEPEFLGKYNFSNVVYKDITLYAKWIEEDPVKQEEVVTDITELRELVLPFIGEFELDAANEILSTVYDVMGYVLDDAANGVPIYDGDYILDNYGEEISDANDLYDGMTKDEQSNFYSVLLTELGEEKADRLLQTMFGINISDAKDKIDK